MQRLHGWKEEMKQMVLCSAKRQHGEGGGGDTEGEIAPLTFPDSRGANVQLLGAEAALTAAEVSDLGTDQKRAYDIIMWHLHQTMAGANPPPLRMVIHGEGGRGKFKVIQTTTQGFVEQVVRDLLMKTAYTGIAASIIDGKTTHAVANISVRRTRTMSDETRPKLQRFWRMCQYLVIDEFSMIRKSFLSLLSRNIGIGKENGSSPNSSASFGGLSVILCGDLHQFPPVETASYEALYRPTKSATEPEDVQMGRRIYQEFNTVVVLKEQRRVTDTEWLGFLQNLRNGQVQEI
jgi:hypothetical protein